MVDINGRDAKHRQGSGPCLHVYEAVGALDEGLRRLRDDREVVVAEAELVLQLLVLLIANEPPAPPADQPRKKDQPRMDERAMRTAETGEQTYEQWKG